MEELCEVMTLLEQNPTVEYSNLVKDEEENFKVWGREGCGWETCSTFSLLCVSLTLSEHV